MKYYEIIQYKETRRYLVAGVLVEGGDSVDRAHTGFKELLRELWQSYDVQPLCDFRIFHILLILFHSKGERNGLEPVLTQRQLGKAPWFRQSGTYSLFICNQDMAHRINLTPWDQINPLISVAPIASAEELVQKAREDGLRMPSNSVLRQGSASLRTRRFSCFM